MRYYVILGLFFLSFLVSCSSNEKVEKPLARVHDEYLYPTDLKELFVEQMSPEDSVKLVQGFIEAWARKRVLISLAEKNLTEVEQDVSSELENYRISLLIYKYQQEFIAQRLDTVVSEQQIQEYFEKHPNEFKLTDNVVKAMYIQLPRSAPNLETVKTYYISDKERDLKKLDEYCNKYAFKFDDFKNNWVSFNTILTNLPITIEDQETFLKTNKTIEVSDSSYCYFLRIKDYQLKDSPAPIDFASQSIIPILLAKRKVDVLKQLENKVFNDAIKNKEIEYFK